MRWTGLFAAGVGLAILSPAMAQDAQNGEQVFRKCRACHEAGPGAGNKAGPQLTGIVGRPAAAASGFNYSEAVRKAAAGGLVWTEDKLSAFLESPTGFMPKNKMAFAGLKNGAERDDLVAYLKSR